MKLINNTLKDWVSKDGAGNTNQRIVMILLSICAPASQFKIFALQYKDLGYTPNIKKVLGEPINATVSSVLVSDKFKVFSL